ncbi:sodium/hydrogen exchanger 1-like isoform X2 [Musa acuminata AAA Group]|uniref:sodium/hydrogen exchanger 1-like isoform X2 n=1 Tax=Musa acuminata AAA Group TaxID=214697 RepID=UPI0031DABA57
MATSTVLSLPASDIPTTVATASVVVSITVFVALLCACLVIGHLLEGSRWANESIASLLLGLCAGLVMLLVTKWKRSRILTFDEELFFIYLLPPIIFNAGFQVKKKQFFRNFSTILLFGVLGTLISFCIISTGSYFLFKQIGITSLKIQQYLVQSLNLSHVKAMTAIKLFGTFLYLFFTSTALGVMIGLLSAYIIKKLYFGRHSTNREVAIMLLLAYLSYMIAELLSLSGILTIFFCGIIMSHYTWHNVTERSRITTRHAFAAMSFISETFIFLYVGMDALDIDKWKRSDASVGTTVAASGTLFALVMVGRAIFVFSLANFANFFRHASDAKIDLRQQFVIWWAGLMRGSVTIALSYNQFSTSSSKEGAFMITNSIVVVLFSTVVFGSVTKPLIKAALCHNWTSTNGEDAHLSSLEDINILFPDNCRTSGNDTSHANPRSSLGMLIMHPTSTIHYLWRRFDDRHMRPVFGGRGFVPLLSSSTLTSPDGADGV